jgi:hypothetical protein
MTRKYLEESHAEAGEYATYLEERYQGEVYGEALFRTMAERCDEPQRVAKLRVLEQLERETKEAILPALLEVGGSGKESAERVADGETLGAQLANAPWPDLMRGFQTELARFVADFEAAESLAPADEQPLLRQVTAHERALLDFANRESDPDDERDPLESVVALLRSPPTAV